jgi:gliding motility-associated-like protein
VFSPNGDGVNDLFIIQNLLLYDYRQVIVYNRWGKTIYSSSQYNNNWDGKNVPDGVYFVVVNILNGGVLQEFSGTLTILKG